MYDLKKKVLLLLFLNLRSAMGMIQLQHYDYFGNCNCLPPRARYYDPVCGSDGQLYQNQLCISICNPRITIQNSEICGWSQKTENNYQTYSGLEGLRGRFSGFDYPVLSEYMDNVYGNEDNIHGNDAYAISVYKIPGRNVYGGFGYDAVGNSEGIERNAYGGNIFTERHGYNGNAFGGNRGNTFGGNGG